jgi:hypothetical protein
MTVPLAPAKRSSELEPWSKMAEATHDAKLIRRLLGEIDTIAARAIGAGALRQSKLTRRVN